MVGDGGASPDGEGFDWSLMGSIDSSGTKREPGGGVGRPGRECQPSIDTTRDVASDGGHHHRRPDHRAGAGRCGDHPAEQTLSQGPISLATPRRHRSRRTATHSTRPGAAPARSYLTWRRSPRGGPPAPVDREVQGADCHDHGQQEEGRVRWGRQAPSQTGPDQRQ